MTDKEAYNEAIKQSHEIGKFLELPRCISCEHYQTGGKGAQCVKHGGIPDEYLYTPNECPDYQFEIPF